MTTTTPKLRGLIMSGDNVRKTLAGLKTQTRRTIRPQPAGEFGIKPFFRNREGRVESWKTGPVSFPDMGGGPIITMRYKVGDRLYLKEGWWKPPAITTRMLHDGADTWPKCAYVADGDADIWSHLGWKRMSPLFMPAWASRATIEITAVKVERVQSISRDDAKAEGIEEFGNSHEYDNRTTIENFAVKWDAINGDGAWDKNPWVAAYTYKVVK